MKYIPFWIVGSSFLVTLAFILLVVPSLPKTETAPRDTKATDFQIDPEQTDENHMHLVEIDDTPPKDFAPIIEHSQIVDKPVESVQNKNATQDFYADNITGSYDPALAKTIKYSDTRWLAPVSAYSGIESCTNPTCMMASGKVAYFGAAACPREIPLGTQVIIHYMTYTCEDRTALKYDGRFDIFLGYREFDHAQALKYGLRTYEVTILK